MYQLNHNGQSLAEMSKTIKYDGCRSIGVLPAKKLFLPGKWQKPFSRHFAGADFTMVFTDYNNLVAKNQ